MSNGPQQSLIGHNGVMRKGFLGIFVLLACLLAGCNTTLMGAGGKTPKYPIKKIVSLSPSTTEIVGAMQLQGKLVGKTSSCDHPFGIESAVVVVNGTKPDFEKIASMKPDLIVYDAKLYSNTDMSKFQALDPKPEIMAMDVDSIDGLLDYVYKVGGICQAASFASKLADDIYAATQNAKAGQSPVKPRVAVFTGSGGSYYVAGTESFLADVVRNCGGTPVGPTGKVFAPMSIEALVQADPEIVLISEKGTQVISDPRLASISAVRAKPTARVYEVAPGILLRTGPRVKELIDSLSNTIQQVRQSNGAKG